jgi:hypothetical protein
VRKASLEFWAVPDEARRKPVFESPRDAAARLLQSNAAVLLAASEIVLEDAGSLEAQVCEVLYLEKAQAPLGLRSVG